MRNTDHIKLEPETRDALGLSDELTTAGNVAADLVHAVHATDHDPFAGGNLGWADEPEAVLAFLVGIVATVDEAYDANGAAGLLGADWTEEADSAVPIYTGARIAVWTALRDYCDEDEARALAGEDADLVEQMGLCLYLFASHAFYTFSDLVAQEAEEVDA